MCRDYYVLQFMDRSVDTSPIAPALANFFDDVLDRSISQLNFKVCLLTFPRRGLMWAQFRACKILETLRLRVHWPRRRSFSRLCL